VQLYFQIALSGRRDLAVLRDPRVGFEMTLLRMLAFRPADAEAPRAGAGDAAGVPRAPQSSASNRAATGPAAPQAAPRRDTPTAVPSAAPPRVADAANSKANGAPAGEVDWPTVLRSLDLRGPARQLADHCDLQSHSGGAWQLVLPADKQHLNTQQLRGRIESALREHFGKELRLAIVAGTPSRPTPADIRLASENERMRAAREAIEKDPNVRALQEQFGATLEADSIRPAK
jgi:DNA polymerase-3 subunit gamma/tau